MNPTIGWAVKWFNPITGNGVLTIFLEYLDARGFVESLTEKTDHSLYRLDGELIPTDQIRRTA